MWDGERVGRALCILAGLLLTLSATAYAQFVPGTPPPVSGHLLTEEGIVPADVLARVQLLRDAPRF